MTEITMPISFPMTPVEDTPITGKDLIRWGIPGGDHYPTLMTMANSMRKLGLGSEAIEKIIKQAWADIELSRARAGMRDPGTVSFLNFLPKPTTYHEIVNHENVVKHMQEVMRLPTVRSGAVMADACPAGPTLGTIPVGGVVETIGTIHPGLHSADVCCSLYRTAFYGVDPKRLLDTAQEITHFGPGGRSDQYFEPGIYLSSLLSKFGRNPFLHGLEEVAMSHFMTQGDGNHFLFVGRDRQDKNEVSLITHHGSRGLGAQVYKRGMATAKAMTAKVAIVPDHLSWLSMGTKEGQDYWTALMIVKEWTHLNHQAIHDAIFRKSRHNNMGSYAHWNPHNFVFSKGNSYFHAKGATPMYSGSRSIIPLNMGEPILIAEGLPDSPYAFAPHGAGRLMSRTEFKKGIEDEEAFVADQTKGIDARWYLGKADPSECPAAYKDADIIRHSIETNKLGRITSIIDPYGSIMAGERT